MSNESLSQGLTQKDYLDAESILHTLSSFESCSISSILSNPNCCDSFKSLTNMYPNYSIIDLLNFVKMSKLYELRYISQDTYAALKELYNSRLKLLSCDKCDVDIVNEIDEELSKYSITPYMTIEDLLEDNIFYNSIERYIDMDGTKKLAKRIGEEIKS